MLTLLTSFLILFQSIRILFEIYSLPGNHILARIRPDSGQIWSEKLILSTVSNSNSSYTEFYADLFICQVQLTKIIPWRFRDCRQNLLFRPESDQILPEKLIPAGFWPECDSRVEATQPFGNAALKNFGYNLV